MTTPEPTKRVPMRPAMTAEDFVAKVLPDVAKRHRFDSSTGIITTPNPHWRGPHEDNGGEPSTLCPITAACFDDPEYGHLAFHTGDMVAAGKLLGLSDDDARRIASSADNQPCEVYGAEDSFPHFDVKLRAAILAALGLDPDPCGWCERHHDLDADCPPKKEATP